MNNITLLDCTLRDGGYINQWNWGEDTLKEIIKNLSESRINIVECGFLQGVLYQKDFSLFQTIFQINQFLPCNTETMFVLMYNVNDKDISINDLPEYSGNGVNGIRLAFNKNDRFKALSLAEIIQTKGYCVFLQAMNTSFYSDLELLQFIEDINAINPYAFYIVDTLGSMNAEVLLRLFYLIDHNLKEEIRIGFHGHNNLQLAFSNAMCLVVLQTKRKIILDATVFGMGRGSGNLCTELIIDYLNKIQRTQYDCTKIFYIIDSYMLGVKREFDWGYSAPYYLAATKNCHPNYATYLISKGTLLSSDIDKILGLIPKEESYLFDENMVQNLYLEYQRHQVVDDETRQHLFEIFHKKSVLLIAPGASIRTEEDEILSKIKTHNIISVMINFFDSFDTDFVFISNKKRFQDLKELKTPIIATSNLDYGSIPCHVINYTSLLNQSNTCYDNAGLIGINLMIELGVQELFLAGFDGFSDNHYHFDQRKCRHIKKEEYLQRNKDMEEMIQYYQTKITISFITKTKYFRNEGTEE